jgi:hypothetical protein
MLLMSLACDAIALGSNQVEVEVCMIPLEHFRTIDYVHVREGRLVYLQKFTGAG